jgi:hypothetical protein
LVGFIVVNRLGNPSARISKNLANGSVADVEPKEDVISPILE